MSYDEKVNTIPFKELPRLLFIFEKDVKLLSILEHSVTRKQEVLGSE